MLLTNYDKVYVQPIFSTAIQSTLKLNILRLDKLHPIVSGNKWFKLKLQIQAALTNSFETVATFGGAYSNHIVAAAYACNNSGLKSIGIIRGDEPKQLNHTLLAAQAFGMELHFISRQDYENKLLTKDRFSSKNLYWINEGGYAILGADGVTEMYKWIDETYTHIIASVGTGTMLAGLIKGALPNQKVIGISVLKGHKSLLNEIENLLSENERQKQYELINDYHFGGYAKYPKELINWMNDLYKKHHVPTDIIYTSKLTYGVFDLIEKNYFPDNSKIMVIHSGGLQGNLSLPKNTLVFD